jgi:hypothetical protein
MMKKLLTAVTASALGLLAAAPAMATETRVNSLSGGNIQLTGTNAVNEKILTLKDQANIYPFPQYLPDYKNSVDVDTTQGASYGTMNIRYALSDDAVLLLYGKRSPWKPVSSVQSVAGKTAPGNAGFDPTNAGFGPTNPGEDPPLAGGDPTNHQFGVGFGMKAGETTRLGAHLGIGGSNNSSAQTRDNTLVDFNAGVGFDVGEDNKIDFGLGLQIGSFTDEDATGTLYEPNGLFRFGLLFKGEFKVHEIAWLVPYLNFAYDTRGVIDNANQPAQPVAKLGSLSLTTLQLGADLSIRRKLFDRDILIQPGLGLAIATSTVTGNSAGVQGADVTTDNSSNRIVPYYGFAAEAHAFDWMILRLGARQQIVVTNIGNTAPTGGSNETHQSTVLNTVTTGMGFQLLGWTLDINVNPQFFNNGPAIATGNGTAGWGVDWALYYKWN